jgi:hypothetical protein
METFTFEIIWPDGERVVAGSISLPGHEGLWCHVETLALRRKDLVGAVSAVIRVKDSNGGIIIRAGVVTARATVTLCPCSGCPLKYGREPLDAADICAFNRTKRPQ